MKRRWMLPIIAIFLMCIMLGGCSSKFVCSLCQEEKTGKQYTANNFGISMTICEECNARMNVLMGSSY